jgi:hypothetical protein
MDSDVLHHSKEYRRRGYKPRKQVSPVYGVSDQPMLRPTVLHGQALSQVEATPEQVAVWCNDLYDNKPQPSS